MFICIFNATIAGEALPIDPSQSPLPFPRLVDNNRSAQTTSAICKLSMEPFALKQRAAHFIYPSLSSSLFHSLSLTSFAFSFFPFVALLFFFVSFFYCSFN